MTQQVKKPSISDYIGFNMLGFINVIFILYAIIEAFTMVIYDQDLLLTFMNPNLPWFTGYVLSGRYIMFALFEYIFTMHAVERFRLAASDGKITAKEWLGILFSGLFGIMWTYAIYSVFRLNAGLSIATGINPLAWAETGRAMSQGEFVQCILICASPLLAIAALLFDNISMQKKTKGRAKKNVVSGGKGTGGGQNGKNPFDDVLAWLDFLYPVFEGSQYAGLPAANKPSALIMKKLKTLDKKAANKSTAILQSHMIKLLTVYNQKLDNKPTKTGLNKGDAKTKAAWTTLKQAIKQTVGDVVK